MSETSTIDSVTDWTRRRTETPEQRRERLQRLMAELREIHRQILADRGGVPISAEVITEVLDEVRGRTHADRLIRACSCTQACPVNSPERPRLR